MDEETQGMRGRRLLIMAVLLFAVGGLYLWDRQRIKREEIKRAEQERLFPISLGQVREVHLRGAKGTLSLRRTEEGWRILKPLEAKADDQRMERMLSWLLGLKRGRIISRSRDQLALFGLVDPFREVELVDKNGRRSALLLGKKNPTGVYYFARTRGSDNVFLVYDTIEMVTDLDVKEIRERRLWKFDPQDVVEIHIQGPNASIRLVREAPPSGGWVIMDESGPLRADSDRVSRALETLSSLKAVDFVDEKDIDLDQLGLRPPIKSVSLTLKGRPGPGRLMLKLGKRSTPENNRVSAEGIFAQSGNNENVVVIHRRIEEILDTVALSWRYRDLLSFPREAVSRIEISSKGGSVTLSKTGEGLWHIQSPVEAKADFFKVNDLIWSLKGARAVGFPKSPIPSKDQETLLDVRVWVEGSSGSLFLKVLKERDPEGNYLASSSEQPNGAWVDEAWVREIPLDYHHLLDRHILSLSPGDVRAFEVTRGGTRRIFSRRGGSWRAKGPGSREVEVPAEEIQDFLWSLNELEFKEVLPKEAALYQTDMEVRIWAGREKGPMAVGFFRTENARGRAWAARSPTGPGPVVVEAEGMKRFLESLGRVMGDENAP
jgi:hypothetical protein